MGGVQGNGETELCKALMGCGRPPGRCGWTAGTSAQASPRDRLRAGISYIPEDRQEDGIVEDFSVADNMVLDTYDRAPYAKGIAMNLHGHPRVGQAPGGRVRRADLARSTPRSARCPAATSRR